MTTAWTDGYQTTVNYTYGYYKDLSPNFQQFCLLLNGVDCSEQNENHQHCELGFGQGVSLNIHAATSLGRFYGTDFNPAHAAHSTMLAEQSLTPHHFYDLSFEELLDKNDLPMFDSISLHGIWSWISHENQHIILKFIRKLLKPNGIVYISYNCLTGWAANMPVRELFHSHYNFNSTSANPLQKVKDSLNFSEALLTQNPIFARNNPNALNKVKQLKTQNPNYLIHEYLNQDWQCFSFQQIVRTLEDIKLSYAGSTDLNVHLDTINFSDEHQQFINQIEHPIFREQCRDYFSNTQFRKDIFIRGKNTLTPLEIKERLLNTTFALLVPVEEIPKTILGHLGEFDLVQDVYQPIISIYKEYDYEPQKLADIEARYPEINHAKFVNAFVILCHLGLAQPCQNKISSKIFEQSHRLNHYLLQQASFHTNYQVLSCPITGIAFPCTHFTQLFYRAYFIDKLELDASIFAQYIQDTLTALDWYLLDDQNQTIKDLDKSLASLTQIAEKFISSDKILIAKKLKLFSE